jgi:ABC-type transport system substrate-binding protein
VLRVALLDDVSSTNVWALFDEAGANYWNAATQAGYWPVLYHLAPPSLHLQPATAKGAPPPVVCDDFTCTATVTLRPGLTWTDGSAFSAADVVFTINTALQFHLGLNWRQFYNPNVLDHAEALDAFTVKVYFKSHPTAADWQYGVLQGPIVNRAYWQSQIVGALNLLPDESLLRAIEELEAELAWKQAELDGVNISLTAITPESSLYIYTTQRANYLEDDLVGVNNKLEKKRAEYEAKLAEARASLFTLDNTNEPALGPWKFVKRGAGIFESQANLGTPFGNPWFENIQYVAYPDESAAVDALINNQVDLILTPQGLSYDSIYRLEGNPEISLNLDTTRSGRFLAINHADPYLADPALHRALACMLDPGELMEILGGDTVPLSGFILDDFWRNEAALLPCAGITGVARLVEAIRLLKAAGYSWEVEPASGIDGSGLKAPDGNVLPGFTLIAPHQDPLRSLAAVYIAQQAENLGLKLDIKLIDSDDLLYTVYGSANYDMALLGWRLSAYPSYLCDWFMPAGQNPFAYNGINQGFACEAWAQANDLETAKMYAFEVQSALAQDLPLIPLYANVRVDAYRNIRYPFTHVIDGLGGLYGAPALAIPIP